MWNHNSNLSLPIWQWLTGEVYKLFKLFQIPVPFIPIPKTVTETVNAIWNICYIVPLQHINTKTCPEADRCVKFLIFQQWSCTTSLNEDNVVVIQLNIDSCMDGLVNELNSNLLQGNITCNLFWDIAVIYCKCQTLTFESWQCSRHNTESRLEESTSWIAIYLIEK